MEIKLDITLLIVYDISSSLRKGFEPTLKERGEKKMKRLTLEEVRKIAKDLGVEVETNPTGIKYSCWDFNDNTTTYDVDTLKEALQKVYDIALIIKIRNITFKKETLKKDLDIHLPIVYDIYSSLRKGFNLQKKERRNVSIYIR